MIADNIKIKKAGINDMTEILKIQKEAFISEAELYNDYNIEPLHQTLESIQDDFSKYIFLVAEKQKQIIGSVKAREAGDFCWIGRLIVKPEFQNKGIGRRLMTEIENLFANTQKYLLCTGCKSFKNIKLYESLGYRICGEIKDDANPNIKMVKMIKENKNIINSVKVIKT